MESPRRRRFLQTLGTVAAGGLLAGCQTGDDGTPTSTPVGTSTVTATPQATPDSTPSGGDTPRERVRSFVQLFVDGDFESAHDRLSSTAASQISVSQLQQVWQRRTSENGEFTEIASITSQGEKGGLQVFLAQVTFEDGQQRVQVTLGDDAVAGFRLLSAEWTPPAYVDQSAFTEQELTLSAPGDCSLGAALTLPTGSGPVPGVVLVHGNGAQDRDQTIGPNKTFKELAWGLATKGVAVLRYDKRTHACDVNKADATIDDIVTDDALTALDRLRRVDRVPADDVLVVGHSFGATLAPRIATRDGNLAGVVMLAALARPVADAIVDQAKHLANLDGTVTEREQRGIERTKRIAEKIRTLDIADDEVVNGFGGDEFYRTLQEYDHLDAAAELDVPRLLVQGGSDWQVTDEQDLPMWRDALSGESSVRFEVYPDLNHRFQRSTGKETRAEYFQDRPFAESVVTDVAQFVRAST